MLNDKQIAEMKENMDPIYEWVLVSPRGSWVTTAGYVSGNESWKYARTFKNKSDALRALDEPHWHPNPEGVVHCTPACIKITPSLCDRNSPEHLETYQQRRASGKG